MQRLLITAAALGLVVIRMLGGDECDVLDNGIKRVSDLGPQ